MGHSEIERKFINRETTPEDESSIMQAVPKERWMVLCWERERRDLARRWEHLETEMPGAVIGLKDGHGYDSAESAAHKLALGLAFLIEEIHHLNETMAMDRRGRG